MTLVIKTASAATSSSGPLMAAWPMISECKTSTNDIVFALWYWEIDSPALTRSKWSRSDQDFLFPQQENKDKFEGWRPQFLDYLYLSVTNAINFAPAEAKPLTHGAKMLMATQALVSVFTLALVIARSVNILGS